jgi:hypothetical protein
MSDNHRKCGGLCGDVHVCDNWSISFADTTPGPPISIYLHESERQAIIKSRLAEQETS